MSENSLSQQTYLPLLNKFRQFIISKLIEYLDKQGSQELFKIDFTLILDYQADETNEKLKDEYNKSIENMREASLPEVLVEVDRSNGYIRVGPLTTIGIYSTKDFLLGSIAEDIDSELPSTIYDYILFGIMIDERSLPYPYTLEDLTIEELVKLLDYLLSINSNSNDTIGNTPTEDGA